MTSPFDGLPDAFVGALGQAVTVTPVDGVPREIRAIFTAASMETLDMVQPQPLLAARSADVDDLADGATVVVDGVTYTVRVPAPDGRGMTRLTLEG